MILPENSEGVVKLLSNYITYSLSATSIISLRSVFGVVGFYNSLPGMLSIFISALTIVKLSWDLWDKYQSKRNSKNGKRKQIA